MDEFVVGDGMQYAGFDLGGRPAADAIADDAYVAVEPDMLAVLVEPGRVGRNRQPRRAMVDEARRRHLGALVVGVVQHPGGRQRVLQVAIGTEAPDLEVVDDVVGVVAMLAAADAFLRLRRAVEPEGQRRQQGEQRDGKQPAGMLRHERW